MVLSNRLMVFGSSPRHVIVLPSFSSYFYEAYVELRQEKVWNFWERYQQGFEAFILMEPNKYFFTLSVGVKYFWIKTCFCAYSQCRSSAYIWWRVRDLDFKSMITFSTWVNKVWQNSTQKQVTYAEGFIMIYGLGRNFFTIEECVWNYGFWHFIRKEILQVFWIENVGFLCQSHISLHNNLVNMFFL